MTGPQLAAVFLALVGLFGWINTRLLHWPTATVMVLAGLLDTARWRTRNVD